MTEAIGHCHEHGIVHRDLKPEVRWGGLHRARMRASGWRQPALSRRAQNLLYQAPEPNETLKVRACVRPSIPKRDGARGEAITPQARWALTHTRARIFHSWQTLASRRC